MVSNYMVENVFLEKMTREPMLKGVKINMERPNGTLCLNGQVDSFLKKKIAINLAKNIESEPIDSESLKVMLPDSDVKSDAEIAEALHMILEWNAVLFDTNILVDVFNGCVILHGTVDWEYQKDDAEQLASELKGVTSIVNKIELESPLSAKDIRKRIKDVFYYIAKVDYSKVLVETSGSIVVLSGKVSSKVEKANAENAAWMVRGVSKVDNRLEVNA
jgi:osmotically-inducible protein OsmY